MKKVFNKTVGLLMAIVMVFSLVLGSISVSATSSPPPPNQLDGLEQADFDRILKFFQLAIENPNLAHEMVNITVRHSVVFYEDNEDIRNILDMFLVVTEETKDIYQAINETEYIFLDYLLLSIVLNNKQFFNEQNGCEFDRIMSKISRDSYFYRRNERLYNGLSGLSLSWANICNFNNYKYSYDNISKIFTIHFDEELRNLQERARLAKVSLSMDNMCSDESIARGICQIDRTLEKYETIVFNYIQAAKKLKQLLPLELNQESVNAALEDDEIYNAALDFWENMFLMADTYLTVYHVRDEELSQQEEKLPKQTKEELLEEQLYEYLQQNPNQNDGAFAWNGTSNFDW